MTQFDDVHEALAKGLSDKGYSQLTPVQLAMLDPANAEADMLVSAQTGSGKTVAFGLAMAGSLLGDAPRFGPAAQPMALIIAPTRELALQVRREFEWLYAPTGAVIASCVGGMDMRNERRTLDRGAHIVVGTPGRLRDHLERGSLDISDLRVAVLDEADEMLDLGFREDLEFILKGAPETRRTLMFSATVSKDIARLAKSYQRDALRVSTVAEREQHHDIDYRAMVVDMADRENAIVNVLRFYEAKNALVFCATRATVNHLTARFNNRGFQVVALSGELSQAERTHALQAMRDGRARVCVATDVAARGIDLPGLELVVHADLPNNRETLLHRSGRTGRAGSKGVSAVIVPANARKKAERLFASANVNASWGSAPSADEVTRRDTERLLANPDFLRPAEETETDLVKLLIDNFTPEQLATGFARQYLSSRSAPEELRSAGESAKGRDRDEFANSFWVSLSVGSEQRAEPRWILPMLCRAAGLSKRDIGAIRVQTNETLVQLHGDARGRFFESIGADQALEDGVRATETSAPAGGGANAPRPPREDRQKSYRDDKPRHERPAYSDNVRPGPRAASAPPQDDSEQAEPESHPKYSERPDRAPGDDALRAKVYAPKPRRVDSDAPRKPRAYDGDAPRKPRAYDGDAPRSPRPAGASSFGPRTDSARPERGSDSAGDGTRPFKPRHTKSGPAAAEASDTSKRFAPPGAYQGKPGGKPFGDRAGKPAGKTFGDRAGKPGGKPFGDRAGKPAGKSFGKPGGKPSKPRP
jgi:ATP-dependent RNA helicase DeaD